MSIIGPSFEESMRLPQAFNDCTCECHRHEGILHCVPCCYPTPHRNRIAQIDAMFEAEQEPETPEERDEFQRIERENTLRGK